MLITMITDYKGNLQGRLTDSFVKERNAVNQHLKEIAQKMSEVRQIKEGTEEVELELAMIKDNEQEYLRLQSEHYKRLEEQQHL